LGVTLSPTLSNRLISHHISQITHSHHPGNPMFSKLKMSSVGPLINTPSLLLHPHTKAQPLHLCRMDLPGPGLKHRQPLPTKTEGQNDSLPSIGTILPISDGSALKFYCKRDRKNYFREVCNIIVEGRVERTRWSHIPITFSEEDVNFKVFLTTMPS
jgi:hypothetical protein